MDSSQQLPITALRSWKTCLWTRVLLHHQVQGPGGLRSPAGPAPDTSERSLPSWPTHRSAPPPFSSAEDTSTTVRPDRRLTGETGTVWSSSRYLPVQIHVGVVSSAHWSLLAHQLWTHRHTHTVSSWPACYSNVSPTSWMAVMTTCCTDSSIIIMVWMYSTHTEEQSPLTSDP